MNSKKKTNPSHLIKTYKLFSDAKPSDEIHTGDSKPVFNLVDLSNAYNNPACLIRLVHQSMLYVLEQHLLPLELTAAQWYPIALIDTNKAHTAAELARIIEVDSGAMTRMLDRLEKKGFIKRKRFAEDRRVIKLELTEQGVELNRQMFKVLEHAINLHFANFTQEEFDTLLTLLRKIVLANNPDCLLSD